MTYGRLDVYWPDGPVESHRLDKPTIAVGRSTGNDIVLDTTAVSRYHITLVHKAQQVVLEDLESVNGTYVDGERLAPHQPYALRGGEEILIGDIRLIFHPTSDLTRIVSGDTTQRVTLAQPTYRVELEGPDMAVAPGAHVQAILTIENCGDETDQYFIVLDGLPNGWARIDRLEMELESGAQGQAILSFKPTRQSESQPGDYSFVVRVRSKSKPAQTIDAPAVLRVLPFSGFRLALDQSPADNSGSFKLYLHNQGNAPLSLSIHGTDQAKTLLFDLPRATLTLRPGEHQILHGTVRPRRRMFLGNKREYEFALIARSHDAAGFVASVPGNYIEKGMLPAWVPVLVIPLLAALILLVAGTMLWVLGNGESGDEPAVQPVITSLVLSNPVITLGQNTQVSWRVQDAESVELAVEHQGAQQAYPLETGATSHTLSFDQTGLFTLVLTARNGDAVQTATAAVEVRPVAELTLAIQGLPHLVLYVEQDIQVRWSVSGARSVDGGYSIWLENPDVAGALVPSPLPASGEQTVRVIPINEQGEAWPLTLYAEGNDHVVTSVTRTLPLVYPSCELRAVRTVVRRGPAEAYPALVPPLQSSAEGKLLFSPTARNPNGDWLQVTIGVDNPQVGWVPRADFTCTNFDPARLRPTTDFPPLPAATPAALTPSPSLGSPDVSSVVPSPITVSPVPATAPR